VQYPKAKGFSRERVRQSRRRARGPLLFALRAARARFLAYLPIALRRVYGGSRLMTGVKLVTLGMLYLFAFAVSQPLLIGAALLQS
jgi:hypothetical protein